MVKTDLTIFKDKDLFDYFRAVNSRAFITPFENLERKKFDTKNVAKIKEFRDTTSEYIRCIQELRRRGFTLLEVMEILK